MAVHLCFIYFRFQTVSAELSLFCSMFTLQCGYLCTDFVCWAGLCTLHTHSVQSEQVDNRVKERTNIHRPEPCMIHVLRSKIKTLFTFLFSLSLIYFLINRLHHFKRRHFLLQCLVVRLVFLPFFSLISQLLKIFIFNSVRGASD